jgi:hypothetical protein
VAQKLDAGLPPDLDLTANYTLRFTAVSPTSGSVVAGVTVSNASLLVQQLTPGTADDLAFGPFAPIFVPIPLDTLNGG